MLESRAEQFELRGFLFPFLQFILMDDGKSKLLPIFTENQAIKCISKLSLVQCIDIHIKEGGNEIAHRIDWTS